jgi:hypothetical protein
MDPIVNLRDAHLIELYLHRVSADRDDHLHTHPESLAHVDAMTPDDWLGTDTHS